MRALALTGALFALALAFLAFRPVPTATPGTALRDFEAYYAAGKTWTADQDPYGRAIWNAERTIPGVVASRDEVLPFVGPPFSLPFWAAFARLDYARACIVWRTVLALCALTIVLGALRLSATPVRLREGAATLVLGASFAPLTSGLALGQAAIVSCAALVLGAIALQRQKPFAGGIAAAGAALQPNIGLALLGLLDRPVRFAVFGSAALAVTGLSAWVLGGFGQLARYAVLLQAHANAERLIAIQVTPDAAFRTLGASPHIATALGAAIALFIIVRTVLLFRTGGYDDGARLALSCAALPLVNPFAHEHDLTVALIAGIICLRRAQGAAWLAASIAILLVAVDWLGLAQRPAAAAQAIALALAAALAIAALRREPVRATHVAPAAIALVVAGVSLLARHDPVPIWPDALPLTFHAPPQLPIATVWALEQLRSGVAALHPLWGALRLLSLCGCALLWHTCGLALRHRCARPKVESVHFGANAALDIDVHHIVERRIRIAGIEIL